MDLDEKYHVLQSIAQTARTFKRCVILFFTYLALLDLNNHMINIFVEYNLVISWPIRSSVFIKMFTFRPTWLCQKGTKRGCNVEYALSSIQTGTRLELLLYGNWITEYNNDPIHDRWFWKKQTNKQKTNKKKTNKSKIKTKQNKKPIKNCVSSPPPILPLVTRYVILAITSENLHWTW